MKTVFVGLSGGVDSSVAALRLKNQGYNVVGVFIKVWHPDWLVCNWQQERLDAMRVAARLDIPFLTCNAESAYKQGVADYFISEYKAGRTPNPDVLCNQQVKFGAFLEFAHERGADFVATGHYAQNIKHDDTYELHRGIDSEKDQTYFLWTLTQTQLAQVLLPVGDTNKTNIRQEALAATLPTSAKKDSQGVCFLGHIDIREFLSHYTDLVAGDVLNEEGTVVGVHNGALIYTTGQRHGFTVWPTHTNATAHYVLDRDLAHNTITVGATKPILNTNDTIAIRHTNWIDQRPHIGDQIDIQIRYRQTPVPATIKEITEDTAHIEPTEQIDTPAAGQSLVCYRNTHCLGGGIIA